jgi:hypothetical protein
MLGLAPFSLPRLGPYQDLILEDEAARIFAKANGWRSPNWLADHGQLFTLAELVTGFYPVEERNYGGEVDPGSDDALWRWHWTWLECLTDPSEQHPVGMVLHICRPDAPGSEVIPDTRPRESPAMSLLIDSTWPHLRTAASHNPDTSGANIQVPRYPGLRTDLLPVSWYDPYGCDAWLLRPARSSGASIGG